MMNRMKFIWSLMMVGLLAVFRVSAQVDVEVSFSQEQFLPNESIPVTVKITNRSGQPLHLGEKADWLTFSIEASDNYVVMKNSEVPVQGAFDLESSQMGIKHVDLQPSFLLQRPGRYRVTATMRIDQWQASCSSKPVAFDVISGAKLWEQEFGVPGDTNRQPEIRKYVLLQANYFKGQLRLYGEVSDASGSDVIKVLPLGSMVSFSQPVEQVNRLGNLAVLWQTGAQSFSYSVLSPGGALVQQEIYDSFGSRPRLDVNDNGEVVVVGGVRRLHPGELPTIKLPTEIPAAEKVGP
jgi:hypothetical protein